MFDRYIGIDYSGAQVPTSSLPGLRIYMSDRDTLPIEIGPPPSPRKYWTRREVAQWLVERLRENVPSIIGIDHGFSFPLRYFEYYNLEADWPAFLDDFQEHWPTDDDYMYVCFVQDGHYGNGAARSGNPKWRRLTEIRAGAKSVFHFNVPGTVAHSTHAGLPWLRYIRNSIGGGVHFWPFDGWDIPEGKSVMVEVYPSLWNKGLPISASNELGDFEAGLMARIFGPVLAVTIGGVGAVGASLWWMRLFPSLAKADGFEPVVEHEKARQ